MRITLKDVAREAGTSTAAVSVTLSGSRKNNVRVSEATRKRIIEAAAKLGYVPNPVARSLSTGRSGVLGLTFPYIDAFVDRNPFCSQVMAGVVQEAIAKGFNTMLYTTRDGFWTARHKIDPRVDGLVIVLPTLDDPLIQQCRESQFPCVAVVSPEFEGVMTVNAQDREGGRIATQHLINLGHERIAMLTGGQAVCTSQPRFEGYLHAMEESGVAIRENLTVEAGHDWRPGYIAMNQLLDLPRSQWPTAVFGVNDLCAAGAIKAMRERNVRVPEDIAVVGFDDTWFAAAAKPGLTSVRMPIRTMGALAVRMLVDEIEETPPVERNVSLGVFLTVRQSCGAKPEDPLHDLIGSEDFYPL